MIELSNPESYYTCDHLLDVCDSTNILTRMGLRKSKLDRKWLWALLSQSLEDLQIIS